jgi:hypothetical protein
MIAVPTTPPQKLTAPAAPVAATTATTTATTTPTASGDVSAAIDKIKSMNKNSFFVQHIALDNAEEAQLWRRQYPALSGAMVTAIQVEGGRRIKYVVVSGPFADRAAANEYAQRAEPVGPDTPAILPPFPAGQPRNRLGLARWLTAPDHPLLARVTVNRVWQALFGTGLVKSPEDLGSQSTRPEYPELLELQNMIKSAYLNKERASQVTETQYRKQVEVVSFLI